MTAFDLLFATVSKGTKYNPCDAYIDWILRWPDAVRGGPVYLRLCFYQNSRTVQAHWLGSTKQLKWFHGWCPSIPRNITASQAKKLFALNIIPPLEGHVKNGGNLIKLSPHGMLVLHKLLGGVLTPMQQLQFELQQVT